MRRTSSLKAHTHLQSAARRERMTSIEIAKLTGKPHNDVLKAIRAMEPAWKKVCQGKFSLTSRTVAQPNGGERDDEARAKLVLRWEQLERENLFVQ